MNRTKLLISAGFFFLAATSMFAGNNEKGIEYYRAALYDAAKIFFLVQTNQTPAEQAENYYYLGQTYYQLNQVDSSAYYYQKAIDAFPEYPFGYVGAGKVLLKKGDARAADELFKKANGLAKKDPSVQTTIAEVYVNAGDYNNAQIALEKARKINNKYSGIYLVEGDMLMKQGKVGDACARYDNAILFNTSDKVSYLKLAQVYKDINSAEAIKYLDKLVALDPNYIPAYAVYGDIYREEGKYKAALDAYEKFIAIPGVPMLQQERYAQLLFFTDQYSKALEQFQYILSKDPNNLVIKRLDAYNNFRLENYAAGLEQIRQLIRDMPKERHIYQDYLYLGKLALKEKQPVEAMDAFQKAIEMDSTKAEIYKETASAAFNAGLYPEAVKYYEKYLSVDNTTEAADYYNYGNACSAAAAYYINPSNMNSVSPDALPAYEAAFRNYVQKGDNAYAEVMKRKPDLPYGYMGRANINALLDNYDGARNKTVVGYAKPLYEQALTFLVNNNDNGARNKDILTSYRYLISYYATLKDNASIIEYSKKILDIDPNDDAARKTLELLKAKY